MSQEKQDKLWPEIKREERTLLEILFYSQGPADGYLLGEEVRDLLLKSGLPLSVLSQIWNLADVNNNNALNVHEFVLAMHLIRGVIGGLPVPMTLPSNLTTSKPCSQIPSPMTQQEREAYHSLLERLDVHKTGHIEGQIAAVVLLASHLPTEILAHIWELSDFGRDGMLDRDEFSIACHLLRYARQGGSLKGPIDVFQYAPERVSPASLLARKRRVSEYEKKKQHLMTLKERRKMQTSQETRRLDLYNEKLVCLQKLFQLLKTLGKGVEADKLLSMIILKDKTENEKQEEIVIRLKKVHEDVRQATVKIILEEQKFSEDIYRIKKCTDELNKILSSNNHAIEEANPFHQLLEQSEEERLDPANNDLGTVHLPFKFSPFDMDLTPDILSSGLKIITERTNSCQSVADVKSILEDCKEFGEEFMGVWGGTPSSSQNEMEEDEIFMEDHDYNEDNWPEFDRSQNSLLGLTNVEVVQLIHQLSDLREKIQTINSEGGRLVFRHLGDYSARKKAIEYETKVAEDRSRRQSVTERLRSRSAGRSRMNEDTTLYSDAGERKTNNSKDEDNKTDREYRHKRQSLDYDVSSLSDEALTKSLHRRRLLRSSTDPASFYDQVLVTKEDSASSSSSARRISFEESPDGFTDKRKQRYSRGDDSSVLTLRSSRRKDDLSLELASIALGRTIHVETIPVPVSTERTKQLELGVKLSQDGQRDVKYVSPSLEKEKQIQKQSAPKSLDKDKSVDIISDSAIKLSNVAAPNTANLLNHVHGNHRTHILTKTNLDEHEKRSSLTTSLKNDLQTKGNVSTGSLNVKETVNPSNTSYLPQDKFETRNNTEIHQETVQVPRPPPRLKKQSIVSETSKEMLSQTSQLHSLKSSVSVTDIQSDIDNIDGDRHLVDADVLKSSQYVENELVNTDTHKVKHLGEKSNSIQNKEENDIARQTSNESHERNWDVSNLRSFFDQDSVQENGTKTVSKQDLKNKPEVKPRVGKVKPRVGEVKPRVGEVNPNTSPKFVRDIDIELTKKENDLTSEQMSRVVHVSVSSVTADNSNTKSEDNLSQLHEDIKNNKPKKDKYSLNNNLDSKDEIVLPPLPLTPCPLIPSGDSSTLVDIHAQTDEENITEVYTVPLKISTNNQDINEFTKLSKVSSSKMSTKYSSDVMSSNLSNSSSLLPRNSIKDNKINEKSPSSETFSEACSSDSISLKSNSSHTDYRDNVVKDITGRDDLSSVTMSHKILSSSSSGSTDATNDVYGRETDYALSSEEYHTSTTSSTEGNYIINHHHENIQPNHTINKKLKELARSHSDFSIEDITFKEREQHVPISKSGTKYLKSSSFPRVAESDGKMFIEVASLDRDDYFSQIFMKDIVDIRHKRGL